MFTLRSLCAFFMASVFIFGVYSCGKNDQPPERSIQDQQPVPAPTETVTIPMNAAGTGPAAYGVNPLSIPEGSSVIWTNSDMVAHTATSDTGVWDTGVIQPGTSSSPVPFNSPGVFPYHCTIHGAASMSGTIEVVSASPSPTPSPSITPSPTPSPSVTPSVTPSPSATMTMTPPKKKSW